MMVNRNCIFSNVFIFHTHSTVNIVGQGVIEEGKSESWYAFGSLFNGRKQSVRILFGTSLAKYSRCGFPGLLNLPDFIGVAIFFFFRSDIHFLGLSFSRIVAAAKDDIETKLSWTSRSCWIDSRDGSQCDSACFVQKVRADLVHVLHQVSLQQKNVSMNSEREL